MFLAHLRIFILRYTNVIIIIKAVHLYSDSLYSMGDFRLEFLAEIGG